MKIVDKGVLDSSFIDFSQPSNFAKKALYYAEEFGHYYCTKDYLIERESLDLFLMFYILNGSIFTKTKDYDVEAVSLLLMSRSSHIVLMEFFPHLPLQSRQQTLMNYYSLRLNTSPLIMTKIFLLTTLPQFQRSVPHISLGFLGRAWA